MSWSASTCFYSQMFMGKEEERKTHLKETEFNLIYLNSLLQWKIILLDSKVSSYSSGHVQIHWMHSYFLSSPNAICTESTSGLLLCLLPHIILISGAFRCNSPSSFPLSLYPCRSEGWRNTFAWHFSGDADS